jgi:hypothetical protein
MAAKQSKLQTKHASPMEPDLQLTSPVLSFGSGSIAGLDSGLHFFSASGTDSLGGFNAAFGPTLAPEQQKLFNFSLSLPGPSGWLNVDSGLNSGTANHAPLDSATAAWTGTEENLAFLSSLTQADTDALYRELMATQAQNSEHATAEPDASSAIHPRFISPDFFTASYDTPNSGPYYSNDNGDLTLVGGVNSAALDALAAWQSNLDAPNQRQHVKPHHIDLSSYPKPIDGLESITANTPLYTSSISERTAGGSADLGAAFFDATNGADDGSHGRLATGQTLASSSDGALTVPTTAASLNLFSTTLVLPTAGHMSLGSTGLWYSIRPEKRKSVDFDELATFELPASVSGRQTTISFPKVAYLNLGSTSTSPTMSTSTFQSSPKRRRLSNPSLFNPQTFDPLEIVAAYPQSYTPAPEQSWNLHNSIGSGSPILSNLYAPPLSSDPSCSILRGPGGHEAKRLNVREVALLRARAIRRAVGVQ